MRALGLSLVVVAVSGCGGMAESPALIDSGTPVDAGGLGDAGPRLDAGVPVDAGGPVDAGAPLVNASEFVSQTIPSSVFAGAVFQVSVTMRNTGTTHWVLGPRGHYLGSEGPRDNILWGTNRIFMKEGERVSPGSSYTFTGPVTAPTTPGSYPMKWQMLQDAVEWFGAPTTTVTLAVVQAGAPAGSTPAQIVAFHRNRYPTPMAPAQTVACLRAIAADLQAHNIAGGPFGILVKTAGSNCAGYSCDIICSGQGQQQRQWDVFVDSGGASSPVWSEVGAPVTVRPCELL